MGFDCDEIILPDDEVRDLGVMMNNKGDYSTHINFVYKKVKSRMAWILRSFNNRNIDFMKFVWKTYLLPIIDYCSQLYSPSSGSGLLKLENLQKAFTLKVSGLGHLSYWQRLERMKLFSINRRFERYKMIYVHKILNGKVLNCGLDWNTTECSGRLLNMISVKTFCKSQREQTFQYIGPRLYNTLPRKLRDDTSSTMEEWKILLDKYLAKIPDCPLTTEEIPGLCTFDSVPTNSVIYWIPHLRIDDRRGSQTN